MRIPVIAACLGMLVGCAGAWPNTLAQGPQMPKLEVQKDAAETGGARKPSSRQELRLRIERFADEFTDAVNEPLTFILNNEPDIRRRKLALDMMYVNGSTAVTIASGAFPTVAVLDMVVFISLTRDTIERWGAEYLGRANNDKLLSRFRKYEQEIWEVARSLITPEQEQTLRSLLAEWRENNPDQRHTESIRFGEFIHELDIEDRQTARGLLSSVRNATATADDALQLAERLTYFFQRAPLIWRLHAQIGFFEIMTQPEMGGLLDDADRISRSADRLARNVEVLTSILVEGPQTPEQMALFENIEGGEKRVRGLMSDLRQTLQEANTLAQNVDSLAIRFDVGGATGPDEKPFDIAEYESVATQVTSMTREMTELVQNLNQLLTSPTLQERLPSAVGEAQDVSEEFIRYLVLLVLVVIFSSIIATIFAVLGYRYLAARLDTRLDRHHRT